MVEFEEGIERVVAGLEKQTRIIHEEEKLRVAYHECGHALVACSLPNTDPVHKISIIPRGMGALGYTMSRPEDDRRLFTQSELQNKICVLLGGINAEEIVFKETSTGAQRDLQQASDIARSMVTEFGMSAKLGRVRYSERVRSPVPRHRRAERFGPQRGDDSRDRSRSAADHRRVRQDGLRDPHRPPARAGTDVPRAPRMRSDGRRPSADDHRPAQDDPAAQPGHIRHASGEDRKKLAAAAAEEPLAANRPTGPESTGSLKDGQTEMSAPPWYCGLEDLIQ